MARPTKYKTEFSRIAQKMTRLGATDVEIADVLEVDLETIANWAWHNEDFASCWSLPNLQPLWASDNVKKGAKVGIPNLQNSH